MGSAPKQKAGAAGALESSGYELGAGLGITGFGVFLASMYRSALRLPEGLAHLPASATASIGETMIAASHIGGEQAVALVQAARAGFSSTHTTVLLTAAVLVAVLAIFVLVSLRTYREADVNVAH